MHSGHLAPVLITLNFKLLLPLTAGLRDRRPTGAARVRRRLPLAGVLVYLFCASEDTALALAAVGCLLLLLLLRLLLLLILLFLLPLCYSCSCSCS